MMFPGDNGTPTAAVTMYAAGIGNLPKSWLLCDGRAVSRATYANLFNTIGTTYGAGDGSTTFNLPNFLGRVPVGFNTGDSNFNAVGKTGGESAHTLTIAEMPTHNHYVTGAPGYFGYGGSATPSGPASGSGYGTDLSTINTGNTGGGGSHNNLQPYLTLYFIIKT